MKKLTIIADDFGISHGVNKAIFECAAAKVITGISVLATGAALNELQSFVETFPDMQVGIHYDLVSGNYLTDLDLKITPAKLAMKVIFDKKLLKKIDIELRRQTEKILNVIHPAHVDSHRHTHFIPQIFKLVNAIADDYTINRIRIPVPKLKLKNLKFIFNRNDFYKFLPFYVWKYFNETNASSNDDFFGLFQAGRLTPEYLQHITDEEFNYAELMVHPGYVDDTLVKAGDNLLYKREKELKLLIDFFGDRKSWIELV